ncbi:site-specific integrase [Terrisporobacter mayombei]|nr:site-specific integrase [Terrisporobacter mayombei]
MAIEDMTNLQESVEQAQVTKEIDYEVFINEYKKFINDNECLSKQSAKAESEGTFDSDLWLLYDDNSQQHGYIEFKKLRDLEKFKNISSTEIDILKCYLVQQLDDGLSTHTICIRFRDIEEFIFSTKNFDWETIDSDKGNLIDTLFDNKNSSKRKIKNKGHILSYLDFLEEYDLITEDQLKVYSYLYNKKFLYEKSKPRILPSNKEIFNFDFIIKDFFYNYSKEKEEECIERKIYKPLLIWWKLGNIIPLRVSEMCRKMPRECIYKDKEDGRYFLKVNRVKVKVENRMVSRSSRPSIPLLTEIEITEDIYNLIDEYIKETEFDNDRENLFSYNAAVQFRREYIKLNRGKESITFSPHDIKFKKEGFTRTVMSSLLESFYTNIVENRYNVHPDKRINLGDLRHLAFSSLVYQGVNPIDIAMLGGHTSLGTQDHYVGHARYYIDSEIIDFVTGRKLPRENYRDSLAIKILKETSWEPPKSLSDCNPTEDGVGYCVADTEKDECDDVLLCPYCSKWWCEPTNESFIKIRKYIEDNNISPLMKLIDQQEQFLQKLILEAEVVNVNGLIEMEQSDSEKIRELSFKIRSNAERLLYFKKSLIEMKDRSVLK